MVELYYTNAKEKCKMDEQYMEVQDKLIVLYVLDKMEMPLAEESILSICADANDWMPYINCQHALNRLTEASLIHRNVAQKTIYTITPSGRDCLANFYTRIPLSRREEINDFIRKERLAYKKNQELFRDYYKNKDGTYTVHVSICEMESDTPMLDIKLSVDTRKSAKYIYNHWDEKAAKIYELLYDNLFD